MHCHRNLDRNLSSISIDFNTFAAKLKSINLSRKVCVMGKLIATTETSTVNTIVSGGQGSVDASALIDGGYIVVWTDASASVGDVSGNAIRAQIFNANGTHRGTEFLVNTATLGNQIAPDVIALANGNVAISWTDNSPPNSIRGQILAPDGTFIGSEFILAGRAPTTSTEPALAALPTGGFVATWSVFDTDPVGDGSNSGIAGRVFNSLGQPSGTAFRVNTQTNSFQYGANVAALDNGEFVIVWQSHNGLPGIDYDIKAQRFSSSGVKIGGEFLVNQSSTTGLQFDPEITRLTGGGFVIGWEDNLSHSYHARVFTPNGLPVGTEIQFDNLTGSLALVALSDGRFTAIWSSTIIFADHTDSHVIAQVFNADGTLSGHEFVLNNQDRSYSVNVSASVLTDGRILVSWTDVINGTTTGSDIAARILSFDSGNTAPAFTSYGGNAFGDVFAPESTFPSVVATLVGSDANQDNFVYSIAGGADAGLFTLDPVTGTLTFDAVADFEAPADANGDNIYEIAIAASDGSDQAIQTIRLHITDMGEGTPAADTLRGTSRGDIMNGLAGNDVILGFEGDDRLSGGSDNDVLVGGNGNDTMAGGAGLNEVIGGTGDDIYIVETRTDSTYELAGEGIDEVRTALYIYGLQDNIENLSATDSGLHGALVGNTLDNVIAGGAGVDSLFGRAGNDTLRGGAGAANTLLGQEGDDLYIIEATGDSIFESVGQGIDTVETALSQFVLRPNVENLTYTGIACFIGIGADNDNALRGGNSDDFLSGLAGNDVITGGEGADILLGGSGEDQFRFEGTGDIGDRILDFESGTDKIALSASGFGFMPSFSFIQGSAPTPDSTAFTFLYDTATGVLSFDFDGSDYIPEMVLAQLNPGQTLAADDFFFY